MIEALIVAGLMSVPKKPTAELLEPKPIVETVQVEQPVEITLEEKIKINFYKCDESVQWIRADDATCLKKATPLVQSTVKTAVRGSSAGNTYTPRNCTFYAKSRRPDLPNNLGNASTWVSRAASQGFATGSVPRVGSIGQQGNHVVVIEKVEGNKVYLSELNFDFNGGYRERWADASSFQYIY